MTPQVVTVAGEGVQGKDKQPWEAQVDWIYAGHGEWSQTETGEPGEQLPREPDLGWTCQNQKGAMEFPEHLNRYITKEKKYGVVVRPYHKIPLQLKIGISQLSTRPKKCSTD